LPNQGDVAAYENFILLAQGPDISDKIAKSFFVTGIRVKARGGFHAGRMARQSGSSPVGLHASAGGNCATSMVVCGRSAFLSERERLGRN
jgi:hypothetical protein